MPQCTTISSSSDQQTKAYFRLCGFDEEDLDVVLLVHDVPELLEGGKVCGALRAVGGGPHDEGELGVGEVFHDIGHDVLAGFDLADVGVDADTDPSSPLQLLMSDVYPQVRKLERDLLAERFARRQSSVIAMATGPCGRGSATPTRAQHGVIGDVQPKRPNRLITLPL